MSDPIPGHVPYSVTATTAAATSNGGPGSGWIPHDSDFVVVTSSSSAKFAILSDKIGIGTTILLVNYANGFKLGTPAASSLTINNVDTSGGTASAAIPASTMQEITRTSATAFIMRSNTALGAVGTPIVPS